MTSTSLATIYILEHEDGTRETLQGFEGVIIFETIGALLKWQKRGELLVDEVEDYVYQIVAMDDIGSRARRVRRVILRNYP